MVNERPPDIAAFLFPPQKGQCKHDYQNFTNIPGFIITVSIYTQTGAWEPGQKGWAVTVPLPEPTSQLVSAHHLIEKLYFFSFTHRLNSCSQTIDYPFTVVAVVFHQTLWDSPYHFMLSAKSICQRFLSLDTHLTVKVFCQKLNAWVFSLPRYTKRLCNTRTHHALLYCIWKQSPPQHLFITY